MELFFFIELILNFQQGFKNDDGIEIYDRKQIRSNYYRSTFCFDFLPLVSGISELIFELFMESPNFRALRTLSFLRLLKLPFGSRNRRIASAFSKSGEPNEIVLKLLHVFVFIIWVLCLGFTTRAIIVSLENKLKIKTL